MSRILVVRMSSMGDLVHTLPAITDLTRRFPSFEIDWLAEEGFVDIPFLHSSVSQVVPLALRRWRKQWWKPASWLELRQLYRDLQFAHYDLIVDCQGLLKSAVIASWAKKCPLGGFDRHSIREPLASFFYDKTFSVPRDLSAVDRNRLLFGRIFGYTPDLQQVDFGLKPPSPLPWLEHARPYSVFLTATSRSEKEWPESSWIALAHHPVMAGQTFVLPWGSALEKQRAERLAAAIPRAMVAPKLSLAEAAALLAHAAAVVGVDTGLSHLANAYDRPLVGIYTDTDPALTGIIESPRARNLGGKAQLPSVETVAQAVSEVRQA